MESEVERERECPRESRPRTHAFLMTCNTHGMLCTGGLHILFSRSLSGSARYQSSPWSPQHTLSGLDLSSKQGVDNPRAVSRPRL